MIISNRNALAARSRVARVIGNRPGNNSSAYRVGIRSIARTIIVIQHARHATVVTRGRCCNGDSSITRAAIGTLVNISPARDSRILIISNSNALAARSRVARVIGNSPGNNSRPYRVGI